MTARAEISGNFYQGAVRIGPTNEPCNSTIEGTVRWNITDKVHEFCNAANWTRVVPNCSAWPDDFSFPAVTDATGLQQSSIQQITGISCSNADVSITGDGNPDFRICSDSSCSVVIQNWGNTTATIASNQYLQVRLTASANSLAIRNAVVTVGGQARPWSVTTQDLGTFKYIFGIPSVSPAIGGVVGADAACANAASAAGLGGTYMAWLATGDADDPDTRFTTKAAIPYRKTDGTLVANNWADLTDGNVASNPATRSAANTGLASGPIISNVNTDGTAKYDGTNNCNNWTTNGTLVSHTGATGSTGSGWTDDRSDRLCNFSYHLLVCVKQ